MKVVGKKPNKILAEFQVRRPVVLAFATRSIKRGDEICDSYSGVFSTTSKDDREVVHRRYHFEVSLNHEDDFLSIINAAAL